MERMWRKVNQGLSSTTSTVFKPSTSRNADNGDGQQQTVRYRQHQPIEDDGPVYANVPPNNRGWGYIDTTKCRKRRRKVKGRRNSSKDKSSKVKNGEKPAKETSLRERAVAKLKILNFNINWDVHMKPCGVRSNTNILTRRLCRNRSYDDNELYRSNSFKFERFRRDDTNETNINTLPKQINICDDYSLPIDFVKKRPSSLENSRDVKFADDFASPTIREHPVPIHQNIPNLVLRPEPIRELRPHSTISTTTTATNAKVLKNYCEPKDSKKPKNNRKQSRRQQYNSDSSIPKTSDDELFREESKFESSESVADSFQNFNEPEYANQLRTGTVNPSPYYYGDLGKAATDGGAVSKKVIRSTVTSNSRPPKNFRNPLDPLPPIAKKKLAGLQKRHSFSERDANRCDTFSSTTSDDSNCTECLKRRELRDLHGHNNCDSIRSEVPSPAPGVSGAYNCCGDEYNDNQLDMAPHRLFRPGCLCTDLDSKEDGQNERLRPKSVFYVHQDGEECVDCSLNNISGYLTQDRSQDDDAPYYGNVSRSTGNILDADHMNINSAMLFDLLQDKRDLGSMNKTQNLINCDLNNKILNENDLSNDLQNLNVNGATSSGKPLPQQQRYSAHSPPSTAPMPVKFSSKRTAYRSNIAGASGGDDAGRSADHSSGNLGETPPQRADRHGKKSSGRHHSSKKCAHSMVLPSDRVLQLKQNSRRARQKFSSNESMTSSSVGSMESIGSDTSEGNCSTSSTESHLSASLSSHSSDSSSIRNYSMRAPVIVHANMNVLSPISDKSLEPTLEMLENGAAKKNLQLSIAVGDEASGSQMCSTATSAADQKAKRRYLQNRASLLLKDEIQGSDSGISLQSRDEIKSKNLALHNFNSHQAAQHLIFNNSELSLPEDIANLPFDMPKLRRNKVPELQCPSGSATSVDLGDLPFDMPKLKRRLRDQRASNSFHAPENTDTSGISNASSSQSMRDDNRPGSFRQNLSLQFPKNTTQKFESSTNTRGLHLNLFGGRNSVEIDSKIPLNRQGWYHGSITRVDAECTLRPLREGSFLVRNCESSRNDFSLSLKSARGFMHMRIQQNDTGQFILGEFSQPFESVPEIIRHFCLNRLPVRGAEHMCLIEPVIAQLL